MNTSTNTKEWSINDLMPLCIVPTCPKYGTRHLLPHQEVIVQQIFSTEANYIYWQGGVGSAKTMLYAALAAAYTILIPGCNAILFRKDFKLNYETLWGYFKNSIKAAYEQGIIKGNYNKAWSVKKQGEYTELELPNGSRARCGQTKNWSEYMGPTYDLIVVSDAMENNNFGEIFHGEGVVGGLQSRLRGQKSTFFTLPDGTTKDMRRFLIESNPPPNINELHTIFGREPGERTFTGSNIKYLHIQSNSLQNDHNPPTYVDEIKSMHSDKSDIQRIIEGKTVPYYGGKRVITSFYPEIHVAKFTYDKDLPLLISIDPGLQHPAAVFSQIKRCAFGQEHYISLSEISNLYDITIWDFVEKEDNEYLGILPHIALFYPEHFDYTFYKQLRDRMKDSGTIDALTLSQHFHNIRFAIDKAANKRSAKNKDKLSDRQILYLDYGIQCKALYTLGLEKSIERIIDLHKRVCLCKIPIRMIDKNCSLLIDAYSGGYRFNKRKDGSHDNEPLQDHRYEDIADADRYGIENFFLNTEGTISEDKPKRIENTHPWTWMERGI